MKFLTVLALVLSTSAFAGHDHKKMEEEMRKMPFDQHKKMMQEKLDKKTAMIEEAKTCVNAAKDNDGLMACHEKMKEEKHAMMDEMKDKMKDAKKMKK